jgi:hypothetical protein
MAEAESVEKALDKFQAQLRRLARTTTVFTDLGEVYLDSCIEIKTIRKTGFLPYYKEMRGECQEAISSASTTSSSARDRTISSKTHASRSVRKRVGNFCEENHMLIRKRTRIALVKGSDPHPHTSLRAMRDPVGLTGLRQPRAAGAGRE